MGDHQRLASPHEKYSQSSHSRVDFAASGVAAVIRTGRKSDKRSKGSAAGTFARPRLKEQPKEAIKLEILDSSGKAIRSYSSEEKKEDSGGEEGEREEPPDHIPAKAGLNLFTWDLRYQEPVKVPKAVYDEGSPVGPLVLPGKYDVRLTVGGKSTTLPVEVSLDPRVKTSSADLQKQFDLMLKLRDRQEEMNKAILSIRDLRTQLLTLEKRLGAADRGRTDANKSLIDQSAAVRKKITEIEDELINSKATASEDELHYPTRLNSKFGYLTTQVDSADAAPTEGELGVFAELDGQLETQLARWREVTTKDLPALTDSLRNAGIPVVAPR